MRQFVINELRKDDIEKFSAYLQKNSSPGALDGMFWLALPDNLLDEAQDGHGECGPFLFAVEMGDDFVSFELLVRSRDNLHCSCNSFATTAQRQFVLDFIDNMLAETGVKA